MVTNQEEGVIMNRMKLISSVTALVLILSACGQASVESAQEIDIDVTEAPVEVTMIKEEATPMSANEENVSSRLVPPANSPLPDNPNLTLTFDTENLKDIYLAGGCFWGVEAFIARIYGVYDVTSGYANGATENPSYQEVVRGSGHAETVHVRYDPAHVDLRTLLDFFFEVVDPVSVNKQGNDRGISYRSGIYYTDETDLPVINAKIEELKGQYTKPIATEVQPLRHYYLAEEYHQDYLEKNPNGYCHIEFDAIEEQDVPEETGEYIKPDDATIREMLTPLQYKVTQEDGTERAFENEYWDNKQEGIYVDIVTGEPLFSSATKYASGTGWPSFYEPISDENVVMEEDRSFLMVRTEVSSASGNTHLGHVFPDGPQEHGGLRYCINSASLRFIPYDEMEAEGYGAYKVYVKQ